MTKSKINYSDENIKLIERLISHKVEHWDKRKIHSDKNGCNSKSRNPIVSEDLSLVTCSFCLRRAEFNGIGEAPLRIKDLLKKSNATKNTRMHGYNGAKKNRDHYHKYPEKASARSRSKLLPKPPIGFVRHHWSYKRENSIDIIELDSNFHKFIHRFLEYDSEEFCYRRKDNKEILDSKGKHMEYI